MRDTTGNSQRGIGQVVEHKMKRRSVRPRMTLQVNPRDAIGSNAV